MSGSMQASQMVSKFELNDEMVATFGDLGVFFKGLEAMIGAPSKDVIGTMEREHTKVRVSRGSSNTFGCSEVEFTSGNYGVVTTPRTEWRFVVYNDVEPPPNANGTVRTPLSIEALMDPHIAAERISKQFQNSNRHFGTKFDEKISPSDIEELNLRREEIIGLRLYTGPMYMFYNKVLRLFQATSQQKSPVISSLSADPQNMFTTTLHAINSGIIKLSRIQPATVVYRGMHGMKLPKALLEPNSHCVRGGIEFGFMSTTMDMHTALMYAGAKKAGTSSLFMMRMGLVDRGAQLDWLSQYPEEAEILFAPLTAMEIVGDAKTDDAGVTRYDVRLNCNLRAVTIDELLTVRRSQLIEMRTMFAREMDLSGELPKAKIRAYRRVTEDIKEKSSEEVEKYNNTEVFLALIEESMRDANMLKTDNAYRAERMQRQQEALRYENEHTILSGKNKALELEVKEMRLVVGDYDRLQERLAQHYRTKMSDLEARNEALGAEIARLRKEKVRALLKVKNLRDTIHDVESKMGKLVDAAKKSAVTPAVQPVEDVGSDLVTMEQPAAPTQATPLLAEQNVEKNVINAVSDSADKSDITENANSDALGVLFGLTVLKNGLRWLIRQRRERKALEAERAAELAKQELMLLQRKDNLRSKYKNLRAMAAREVNQRRRLLTQEMRQETEDLGESSAPDASNITADAAPEKRKTRVAMADSVSTPDMAHMAVQCLIDVDEDNVKQRARMVDHFEHALAECRRENAALRRERLKQLARAALLPGPRSGPLPQPPRRRTGARMSPRTNATGSGFKVPRNPVALKPVYPKSSPRTPGTPVTPNPAWPSFAGPTKLSRMRSSNALQQTRLRHTQHLDSNSRSDLLSDWGSSCSIDRTLLWNPRAALHGVPMSAGSMTHR